MKTKDAAVDIPLTVLRDVTTQLEGVYGSKVVIIGGRAVNLQCSMNIRPTHDVDLIVPRKLSASDLSRLPKKSSSPSEYFEYSGDVESSARAKLYYRTDSMEKRIEIDLYYPFYNTNNAIARASRTIGGVIPVPIDAILKESETVKLSSMEFTVPKLEVLMIMKYNTWQERDDKSASSKDLKDIKNIIRNHASGVVEFAMLFDRINSFMYEHIPDKRIETVKGMLEEIPFKDIEDTAHLDLVAASLLHKDLLRTGTYEAR
jgi:hypothetical protein